MCSHDLLLLDPLLCTRQWLRLRPVTLLQHCWRCTGGHVLDDDRARRGRGSGVGEFTGVSEFDVGVDGAANDSSGSNCVGAEEWGGEVGVLAAADLHCVYVRGCRDLSLGGKGMEDWAVGGGGEEVGEDKQRRSGNAW